MQTLRIEEAKQLLETTSLPLTEISEKVGYEDVSYFGKLFRRRTGLTTSEHRLKFGAERFKRYLEQQ